MAKPKTQLVSKAERLRGAGIKVLGEIGTDESLNKCKTTLEKGIALCAAKVDSLSQLPADEVDGNQIYKIAIASATLTKTFIESRRWDAERGGMLLLAEERLRHEIKEQISSDPELVQKLLTVIHESRVKVESTPILVK